MAREPASHTIERLTEDEITAIYQNGELAGMEGRSMLASPYLDDAGLLSIWLHGYLDLPVPDAKPTMST